MSVYLRFFLSSYFPSYFQFIYLTFLSFALFFLISLSLSSYPLSKAQYDRHVEGKNVPSGYITYLQHISISLNFPYYLLFGEGGDLTKKIWFLIRMERFIA